MAKKNESQKTENENIINGVEETAAETTKKKLTTGTVTECVKLNIRKEPSIKADVIEKVPVMTELQIDNDASVEGWYAVHTKSGNNGFCMKQFVSTKR